MPIYDTVIPDSLDQTRALAQQLRDGDIDAVTFTSSSTARNFATLLKGEMEADEFARLMAGVKCVSIGPITSETMRSAEIPVDAEADPYTIVGLTSALSDVFNEEGHSIQ